MSSLLDLNTLLAQYDTDSDSDTETQDTAPKRPLEDAEETTSKRRLISIVDTDAESISVQLPHSQPPQEDHATEDVKTIDDSIPETTEEDRDDLTASISSQSLALPATASSNADSSSDSDSSDSDSDSSDTSSDSDSDSDSDSPAPKKLVPVKAASKAMTDSDSSSDSDSDGPAPKTLVPVKINKATSDSDSDSDSSSDDSSSDDEPVAKKPKLASTPQPNQPFRRVRAEEALALNPVMRDNSFKAQQELGATTKFGENANNVLIKTQGKSFVKAKNKFKNTYRGGALDTTTIRSHKFE